MTLLIINLVNGTETGLKKIVSLQTRVYKKDVKATDSCKEGGELYRNTITQN
jgi:hypothetical protein